MGWTQVELDKKKYHRGLSPVANIPMTKQEANERLTAFEHMKSVVRKTQALIRPELADAYFAAVEYPVLAAAAMNRKILCDSAESHQAYLEIQELTKRYNQLGNGKWRGLMDAAPRQLPVFEDVHGTMTGKEVPTLLQRQACQYDDATQGTQTIQMLGHSMNAVALPKGGKLTYHFQVEQDGEYTLRTALIPTQPNDNGDLRYSVQTDNTETVTYSLKEPFRSERWKQNVLRGQAIREQKLHLTAGSHILTIHALDDHIVIDQWSLVSDRP